MKDIFDTRIMCEKCDTEMQKEEVVKNGARVRAVKCMECGERIIHPQDLNYLKQFNNLKGKTYFVKLRVVGNSHAISIPKEIVEFMSEQQNRDNNQMSQKINNINKQMDEMVRLCFEDFDTLKIRFREEDNVN